MKAMFGLDVAVGQIVCSKAGRDKGRHFVVTLVEDEYAYICDGELRKYKTPKKKKIKHLKPVSAFAPTYIEKTAKGEKLLDSDFTKDIQEFERLLKK